MREATFYHALLNLRKKKAYTMAIQLPALSQEEENKKRAKQAEWDRACLQVAIDLLEKEIKKEMSG